MTDFRSAANKMPIMTQKRVLTQNKTKKHHKWQKHKQFKTNKMKVREIDSERERERKKGEKLRDTTLKAK